MSTNMLRGRVYLCLLMSAFLLASPHSLAIAQMDQSGATAVAESSIENIALDDAGFPSHIGAIPAPDREDVRDTASQADPTYKPLALWQQLETLDLDQRPNAEIELELPNDSTAADQDAAASAASLWNSGQYDSAITQLRELEADGLPLGLGINWKTPQTLSGLRSLDGRIGDTRDSAQTMNLDFDAATGNLFAIIRWGSTTSTAAWTMNISTDNGLNWTEAYTYASSVGLIDVDCAVADDYVYVAYVAGNATDEARLRRCSTTTGGIDSTFGFHVVFDTGEDTVEEVALASNANDYDNRIYYAAIQSDDTLRFAYDVSDDGTTFVETSPADSNPEYGLDMTWDNAREDCSDFLYVSYAGADGNIHVLGHGESTWNDWTVQTAAGSFRTTAISAYEDTIICAFEYPFIDGTGIRYQISYNCGETWSAGAMAVPDGTSTFGYFEPDVDARDGDGIAIIYQAEAGEFDPMYYRTREGFEPGPWTDPILFNDYDVYTGSDTAIGYLPSMYGEQFSHGAIFLSLDPDFRTPYFDRPGNPQPSCSDATPPVVNIDTPDAMDCACNYVSIYGSVDDPQGTYAGDRLEYRREGSTTWIEVDSETIPRSGLLYTWNATGLAEDHYYLRVVAQNECGLENSDTTLVYRPTSFDSAELTLPKDGGVYGGTICITGTANTESCFAEYAVNYRPSGGAIWPPVDPYKPVYTSQVIDGSLATWKSTALGLADGDYDLRLDAETECGNTAADTITITLDNSPPTATLTSPDNCTTFPPDTAIQIHGQVFDDNLDAWTVAIIGGPYNDWQTISGPSHSNTSGLLTTWNTTGLPPCSYTIRLQATDQSSLDCGPSTHAAEAYATITLGALADPDLDQDGDVDLADFALFQEAFTGPIP